MDQIIQLDRYYDADKLLEIYNTTSKEQQVSITGFDSTTPVMTGTAPENANTAGILLDVFKGTYLEEVFNDLSKDYTLGRSRFMTMDKRKTAYSYHKDYTKRLHIPLTTNDDAFFILEDYRTEHMPVLGQLYQLDTTRYHSAVNLSKIDNPRIHLVFAII